MAKEAVTGVSETTPDNILFGAGTIHKGLKYDSTAKSWNLAASIIGATSGGSKLTITPETTDVELDGALVKAKGLTVKTGEKAQIEINFAEITKENLKLAVLGKDGTSGDDTYDLIEAKDSIVTGDYLENIAFVGKTISGRKVIAILDNALCTSGLELEGKNKDSGKIAATFECYATLDSDLSTLPWHIYYTKATA